MIYDFMYILEAVGDAFILAFNRVTELFCALVQLFNKAYCCVFSTFYCDYGCMLSINILSHSQSH